MLDQMPLGCVSTATYVCRKSDTVGTDYDSAIDNRPRKNKYLKNVDIFRWIFVILFTVGYLKCLAESTNLSLLRKILDFNVLV